MDSIIPVYARLVLREMERRNIDIAALFANSSLTRETLLGGGDINIVDFLRILDVGHDRLY